MAAGVNILCYKSKTLANGEHPLMIRICKDGKKKYIGLGISVLPQFWDFKKNKPKRNCPNKEKIEKLIATKINEYNDLIVDLAISQQEYTPETLVSTLDRKTQFQSVESFYDYLIDKFRKEGKLGNAEVYKYSLESLRNCTSNRLNIQFRDIDLQFLKRYEDWLKRRGIKETTISQLFRTMRSAYNKAIENGIVKRDYYPIHGTGTAKSSAQQLSADGTAVLTQNTVEKQIGSILSMKKRDNQK